MLSPMVVVDYLVKHSKSRDTVFCQIISIFISQNSVRPPPPPHPLKKVVITIFYKIFTWLWYSCDRLVFSWAFQRYIIDGFPSSRSGNSGFWTQKAVFLRKWLCVGTGFCHTTAEWDQSPPFPPSSPSRMFYTYTSKSDILFTIRLHKMLATPTDIQPIRDLPP